MFKWNPRAHFYFRLGALIALSLFLIFDLVLAIYLPQPKFKNLGYTERISNYFSFFTTQTNYIVAAYFFLYLFEDKFNNTKPHYVIRLAVTTYITITMLVFWVGIIGQKDQAAQYHFLNWIGTVVLHLVMPVAMITSYFLTAGDKYYPYEDHHKKSLWIIMIYMMLYFLIIMIRGYYRHLDGLDSKTLVPYFFLNLWQSAGDGETMVAAALIIICVLALALQYFYIWMNNLLYLHYHQNKNIKVTKVSFVMRTNWITQIGFIIGFVAVCFNLFYIFLYFVILFEVKYIAQENYLPGFMLDLKLIIAMTVISVFSFIGYIFCFIYAKKGFIGARIAGALFMIGLIFFTWLWYVGPIICLLSALFIFNGKEKVTNVLINDSSGNRKNNKIIKEQIKNEKFQQKLIDKKAI